MSQGNRAGGPDARVPTEADTKDADRDREGLIQWEHLTLVIESDHLLDGGARFCLNGVDEVIIGRGAHLTAVREQRAGKSVVKVMVRNPRASEQHARLTRGPHGWTVTDLGSTNGTFVNEGRLTNPRPVVPGDFIQTGRAFFQLSRFVGPADAELGGDLYSGREQANGLAGFPTLSAPLGERLRRLRPAFESRDPITIVGHTGTGKDLMAQAIHAGSRPRGPFIPIDCSRLASNLIESELFGHAKGAFTSAESASQGQIRAAHGGTAFLDEVLVLPLELQPKLLRVIQQKEVVPLGTARPIVVDVRFIVAAQEHLRDVAEAGRFRLDLYARLDAHVIELPRLRERLVDIGLIVAAVLKRHVGAKGAALKLSTRAISRVLSYSWPLNVRELENKIVSSFRTARDGVLDETAFPEGDVPLGAPAADRDLSPRDRELRNKLIDALRRHGGNLTKVAEALRTNRQQVYRWMDRFGLDRGAFRRPGSGVEDRP